MFRPGHAQSEASLTYTQFSELTTAIPFIGL